MLDDAARLRRAIEAEFGKLDDLAYLDLISKALLDKSLSRPLAKANEPMFREPTTMEDFRRVRQAYPRSIESVVRELSVYKLIPKVGDHIEIEGELTFGIAIAIVDHILKAGELLNYESED